MLPMCSARASRAAEQLAFWTDSVKACGWTARLRHGNAGRHEIWRVERSETHSTARKPLARAHRANASETPSENSPTTSWRVSQLPQRRLTMPPTKPAARRRPPATRRSRRLARTSIALTTRESALHRPNEVGRPRAMTTYPSSAITTIRSVKAVKRKDENGPWAG